MSWPFKTSGKLGKRLAPLYVAAFLQGFVLWYAIEKLFMRGIGFDDATIGVMVAAYSAIMLIVETPSGILADRWSRKGVLILASLALAVSSIVCGLSDDVPTYIIGALFWGIFFALYSGTYDSIIYDTLLEETGSSDSYERYYGRITVMDSIGLVTGSIFGGIVGEVFGLTEVYLWSVPFALLSIIALVKFREPGLHKAEVAAPIKEHVVATFSAVLRNRQLVPVLIVLVILTALTDTLYEFSQLWLIALAAPIVVFGPANALLLATAGLGGLAAGYVKMHRYSVMLITLLVMLVSSIGLVLSRTTSVIVTFQVLLGIGLVGIGIIFTRLLHDSLPSKVRAGASSAVSTFSRLIFIPLSLSLGYVSKELDIFTAGWIIFGLLILASVFVLKTLSGKKELSPVTVSDGVLAEQYKK
jgi:MFS family permease